jgi:uncharacterized coiled-coil protein SlyX
MTRSTLISVSGSSVALAFGTLAGLISTTSVQALAGLIAAFAGLVTAIGALIGGQILPMLRIWWGYEAALARIRDLESTVVEDKKTIAEMSDQVQFNQAAISQERAFSETIRQEFIRFLVSGLCQKDFLEKLDHGVDPIPGAGTGILATVPEEGP